MAPNEVHGRRAGASQPRRVPWVAKKANRRVGAQQHDQVVGGELLARRKRQITQPLGPRQRRLAAETARELLHHQLGAHRRSDTASQPQAGTIDRRPSQQQQRRSRSPQGPRGAFDGLRINGTSDGAGGDTDRHHLVDGVRQQVHRQAHCRDPGHRSPRRRHRLGRIHRELVDGAAGTDPSRRRPRDGLDVRRQRRVVGQQPTSVLAHPHHHRRLGAASVVQVGAGVGEAGSEVNHHTGRPTRHARKSIGGAARDPLEQHRHGAHRRSLVDGADQRHLAGAGVGKANVDAGGDGRGHHRLGAGSHPLRVGDGRRGGAGLVFERRCHRLSSFR